MCTATFFNGIDNIHPSLYYLNDECSLINLFCNLTPYFSEFNVVLHGFELLLKFITILTFSRFEQTRSSDSLGVKNGTGCKIPSCRPIPAFSYHRGSQGRSLVKFLNDACSRWWTTRLFFWKLKKLNSFQKGLSSSLETCLANFDAASD